MLMLFHFHFLDWAIVAIIHFIFSLFITISVPSLEIDGSLGDSEGHKESGSKKRYKMFFFLLCLV